MGNKYPDLEGRSINGPLHDVLADTLLRILHVAHLEMTDQSWTFQTFDYAFELPNLLLQYNFTTLEELGLPPILEYSLEVPVETEKDVD